MSNTINNTQILADNQRVVQYISLLSDGSNETNTVIYNSSTTASTLNKIDPKNCKIMSITYSTNSPAGKFHLLFDATTKVAAWALPYQSNEGDFEFDDYGGLNNFAGAGKTGNLLLTTTGLASGDILTLVIELRPF